MRSSAKCLQLLHGPHFIELCQPILQHVLTRANKLNSHGISFSLIKSHYVADHHVVLNVSSPYVLVRRRLRPHDMASLYVYLLGTFKIANAHALVASCFETRLNMIKPRFQVLVYLILRLYRHL